MYLQMFTLTKKKYYDWDSMISPLFIKVFTFKEFKLGASHWKKEGLYLNHKIPRFLSNY